MFLFLRVSPRHYLKYFIQIAHLTLYKVILFIYLSRHRVPLFYTNYGINTKEYTKKVHLTSSFQYSIHIPPIWLSKQLKGQKKHTVAV